MESLTAFQRDVLFVISDLGAPKGLAIKSELQEYYGDDVNHGRLYPNLDELVERGHVTKGQRDKRTNEYELTDEGRDAMVARMAWERRRTELNPVTEPPRQ